MKDKTLLTTAEARDLQIQLAVIDKKIAEIKSKFLEKLTVREKIKWHKETSKLKKVRNPIAKKLKYTMDYIKSIEKGNESLKALDKYYGGKK